MLEYSFSLKPFSSYTFINISTGSFYVIIHYDVHMYMYTEYIKKDFTQIVARFGSPGLIFMIQKPSCIACVAL